MTNALKYGSLSVDSGRVSVRWSKEGEGEQTVFLFIWEERGGPEAEEPQSKGFGSKLIKRGLMGTGGVALSYTSVGLSVEMTAMLSQLQRAN